MAEIEIVFLGTTAGIPTRERAHPAIHIAFRGEKEFCFLFDCGEGTQRQMLIANLNLMKIQYIFITHWHGDHFLGLPGLVDSMSFEGRTKPLKIFAPEVKKLKKILDFNGIERSFEVIMREVPVEENRIQDLVENEEFKIVSTPVKHGLPSVAYGLVEKEKFRIDKEKAKKLGLPVQGKIYAELKEKGEVVFEGKKITIEEVCMVTKGKKVVYSGDTKICQNLLNLARDADLLIQDCTYFDNGEFDDYEHASIKEIIDAADEIKAKKVILTHISRRYRDTERLKEKIRAYPNWQIAEDFMRVKI